MHYKCLIQLQQHRLLGLHDNNHNSATTGQRNISATANDPSTIGRPSTVRYSSSSSLSPLWPPQLLPSSAAAAAVDIWPNRTKGKVKFMIKAAMATAAVCVYIVALVLCQNVHGYPNFKATIATANGGERGSSSSSGMTDHKRPNQLDVNDVKPAWTQRHRHHSINAESVVLPPSLLVAATSTATPKPPTTTLNDVFISVKTTKRNHHSRIDLVLSTWQQLARHQTWFFTDEDDKQYQDRTNGHMINTNCSNSHMRRDLCCKMSTEFDTFLESRKKWFCHFDDDNYVNVPRLVSLLNEYNPAMEWYLGKPSVASPLEIHLDYKKRKSDVDTKVRFWFATGGAGFCISRALALRMSPIAGGGKLISIGDRIRFPDDVTVGFIIEHLLKVPLTVIDQFHSHLEPMEYLSADTFRDQVSFSYGRIANDWNVISLDGYRSKTEDPTRFHSLHCHLFPYLRTCNRR